MADSGELDTVAKHQNALYRLVGSDAGDTALTEHGEGTNEVVNMYLTRGSRNAQRWMLKMNYGGWRVRSPALSFSGSDDLNGGRYTSVPADFIRTYGNRRDSAIQQSDGTRWGAEIDPSESYNRGNFYYVRGEQLWITRLASLPGSPVYLEYHYKHPAWGDALLDSQIDFPMDARLLIVAEAAAEAREENWLPGGPEMIQKIDRALVHARDVARNVARPTKSPRQMRKATRIGNHW